VKSHAAAAAESPANDDPRSRVRQAQNPRDREHSSIGLRDSIARNSIGAMLTGDSATAMLDR
jgi:hypothetical protein